MNCSLVRLETKLGATIGVMLFDGAAVAWTLELQWKNNRSNVSCIPVGTYKALRHQSKKYGNVWCLQDVPGRTGILVHSGNTVADTQGCIILGERVGWLKGARAVLDSRRAIDYWHALTADAPDLTIDVQP